MAQDPRALLQKADKTLASAGGGFSFFGGREEKYQNAADLYLQAANAFKMQKLSQSRPSHLPRFYRHMIRPQVTSRNREAGQAFEKAAQVQTNNLKEPDDAANTLVDAFKAYRKDDPEAAVRCLDVAVNQYCAKGNFRRAAGHKEALGELFETELGDSKRALESYEAAASWYEGDNAAALANKLWLKVADVASLEGDYYKAIENYEKVAAASINNNLMKYSVKDYFLRAGICHLATGDTVAARRALEKYTEMDPGFAQQRESMLLHDLLAAVEGNNQEEFTDKLFHYDQVSKLDKWKTTLLVRVKNAIEEPEDEFA
ncbi:putative vesicular-fusion protein sec17-like protein [Colletotrichum chlorophyti]|uniref:Putative vesicular-fusion protein sec17-like protein n=1 Tax=Colletotrichum chlorophyti TaxID=708187 RepID=A0A1Q8RYT4_9PEZI|nr:putative vesicular-fusion protein sec17-like protein [Colletotrichum chlorophyti]